MQQPNFKSKSQGLEISRMQMSLFSLAVFLIGLFMFQSTNEISVINSMWVAVFGVAASLNAIKLINALREQGRIFANTALVLNAMLFIYSVFTLITK